jgi:hypothetical protein
MQPDRVILGRMTGLASNPAAKPALITSPRAGSVAVCDHPRARRGEAVGSTGSVSAGGLRATGACAPLPAVRCSGLSERFTERARRVVVLAQEEARLLKHNYIGTEHILLGLAREGEGVANRICSIPAPTRSRSAAGCSTCSRSAARADRRRGDRAAAGGPGSRRGGHAGGDRASWPSRRVTLAPGGCRLAAR